MDHKILNMEIWEETLKFLDRAQKKYKDKATSLTGLEEKLAYIAKANKIADARRTLLSLHFEMEDYVNTGDFEPGKIIFPKPCTTCGK